MIIDIIIGKGIVMLLLFVGNLCGVNFLVDEKIMVFYLNLDILLSNLFVW